MRTKSSFVWANNYQDVLSCYDRLSDALIDHVKRVSHFVSLSCVSKQSECEHDLSEIQRIQKVVTMESSTTTDLYRCLISLIELERKYENKERRLQFNERNGREMEVIIRLSREISDFIAHFVTPPFVLSSFDSDSDFNSNSNSYSNSNFNSNSNLPSDDFSFSTFESPIPFDSISSSTSASSKSNSNDSAPKPHSETPCFCFQVERNPNDFSNSSARFHYQMAYYTCQCDQCIQNPIELFDIVDPNFESYLNSEEIEAFYLYLEFLLSIMKKPGDCFEHTFGSGFSLISCRCCALRGNRVYKKECGYIYEAE